LHAIQGLVARQRQIMLLVRDFHWHHCLLCRYFPQSAKVVVFVNTKRQCDTVASILADKGLACTILHGGKSQVRHHCCQISLQPCQEMCSNAPSSCVTDHLVR
jgi:superfamily II helicase